LSEIEQFAAELLTISHIFAVQFGVGMGHFIRTVLRVREPNFTKLGGIAIIAALQSYKFVSEFRYLAAFSNTDGSKSSDVENDAKFRTF